MDYLLMHIVQKIQGITEPIFPANWDLSFLHQGNGKIHHKSTLAKTTGNSKKNKPIPEGMQNQIVIPRKTHHDHKVICRMGKQIQRKTKVKVMESTSA